MAVKWKEQMDIRREWRACKDGKITIQELSGIVVLKLERTKAFRNEKDEMLKFLVAQLTRVRDDPKATEVDFDFIWDSVYDWADEDHKLWIAHL